MKTRIEVLSVETESGVSKKTGLAYSMVKCQCFVHFENGKRQVGELILPKDHPEVKPGMYEPVWDTSVSIDNKRVGAVLKTLFPVAVATAKVS